MRIGPNGFIVNGRSRRLLLKSLSGSTRCVSDEKQFAILDRYRTETERGRLIGPVSFEGFLRRRDDFTVIRVIGLLDSVVRVSVTQTCSANQGREMAKLGS